ncbi:MAG: large subunit ribosomal protein L10 [Myxococcota bacterium]
MATPAKVAVVDRVSEQMSVAAATLLTDYRGLTVTELAELRVELRKANATYEVVKNTLTRLAAKKAGMDGLDEMLVGPTAIVFCADDPVGPAKALKAFAKTHEELVVKGGYLDGAALTAAEAMQLAELASREELLATMAGLMQGTLSGFARLMNAPLAGMARAMGALEGDGGVEAKGFAPVGAPVAEPVEEAPVEEAPVEEAPVEEAPVAEIVTEDAPEAVAEEAPAAAASEDDAPADDADADA